jgi:hypothetical protein
MTVTQEQVDRVGRFAFGDEPHRPPYTLVDLLASDDGQPVGDAPSEWAGASMRVWSFQSLRSAVEWDREHRPEPGARRTLLAGEEAEAVLIEAADQLDGDAAA